VSSYVHKQHDAAFLSEDTNINLIHCFNKTQDKVKKRKCERSTSITERWKL